jgi:YD repeat-containing protein
MDSMADVMEAVGGGVTPVDHYDELAPVYDFVTARRYDFDALAAFVRRHLPDDAASVCVGACGSGRLLARLADRYDEAVGVDVSPAMCDLASARTDARVVDADLRQYRRPDRFDGYTLLGNSLAHLPGRDVSTFFGSARECLAPDGVLVVDFMRRETLANGHRVEDSFESDRYRVGRTVVVTVEERNPDARGSPARYTYSYDLTDRTTGETVTTGTSTTIRAFDPPDLLSAAMSAGFGEMTLVDPPTPHGGGLVARSKA